MATVRGTRDYRVTLWVEDGDLASSCTCPVGGDGLFCKHCVAVALAYRAGCRSTVETPRASNKPTVTMDDVRLT